MFSFSSTSLLALASAFTLAMAAPSMIARDAAQPSFYVQVQSSNTTINGKYLIANNYELITLSGKDEGAGTVFTLVSDTKDDPSSTKANALAAMNLVSPLAPGLEASTMRETVRTRLANATSYPHSNTATIPSRSSWL